METWSQWAKFSKREGRMIKKDEWIKSLFVARRRRANFFSSPASLLAILESEAERSDQVERFIVFSQAEEAELEKIARKLLVDTPGQARNLLSRILGNRFSGHVVPVYINPNYPEGPIVQKYLRLALRIDGWKL